MCPSMSRLMQVDSEAIPAADPTCALLQRKLRHAAIICEQLYDDVVKQTGTDGFSVEKNTAGFQSFDRVWEIHDSKGTPSRASVACSVHATGSLRVELTKNLSERFDAKATDNARDNTPSVLMRMLSDSGVMIVRVKNPSDASTMCGYWKIVESTQENCPDAVPHHTYANLVSMVRELCSVV